MAATNRFADTAGSHMDPSPTDPTEPVQPPVAWPRVAETEPTPPGNRGSARMRSRWAIAMLGVAGILGVLALISDVSGFGVFDAAELGKLTDKQAEEFDNVFGTIGILQTIAFFPTAVAFLAWLSRSVDNVPRLGGGDPEVKPNWSIIWWFIPFANLFKPYQVVADLYRRMAPIQGIATSIVVAWWVVWVIGNIFANLAGRFWLQADNLETLRSALSLFAISDLLDPIAAGLLIVIVLKVQRWADVREAAPAAPPEAGPGDLSPDPSADAESGPTSANAET